jgi:hypothetical protein
MLSWQDCVDSGVNETQGFWKCTIYFNKYGIILSCLYEECYSVLFPVK